MIDIDDQAGPNPDLVDTAEKLGQHLRLLRVQAGDPSLRELARRAKDHGTNLPMATASDAERGQRVPKVDVVLAYIKACGITEFSQQERWKKAWERARLTSLSNRRRSSKPMMSVSSTNVEPVTLPFDAQPGSDPEPGIFLDELDLSGLVSLLEDLDGPTAARTLGALSFDLAMRLLRTVGPLKRADVLASAEPATAAEYLFTLDIGESAQALEMMAMQQALEVVERADTNWLADVLELIEPERGTLIADGLPTERMAAVLEEAKVDQFTSLLGGMHVRRLAAILKVIGVASAVSLLSAMHVRRGAHILAEVESSFAVRIVEHVDDSRAACWLALTEPRAAARILQTLDPQQAQVLLDRISPRLAARLLSALPHDKALALIDAMPAARTVDVLCASTPGTDLLGEIDAAQAVHLLTANPERAGKILQILDPRTINTALDEFSIQRKAELLAAADVDTAVGVLALMRPTQASMLLQAMDQLSAFVLISTMSLQRAVDILDVMDAQTAGRVLDKIVVPRAAALVGAMNSPSAYEIFDATPYQRQLDLITAMNGAAAAEFLCGQVVKGKVGVLLNLDLDRLCRIVRVMEDEDVDAVIRALPIEVREEVSEKLGLSETLTAPGR